MFHVYLEIEQGLEWWPILRGLAELYGAVSEPSCGLIEEGIKGADGHCLAFSAGPTFATCIAAPSASRWAS
ncbi:hypothetical protein ANTPLA_LOCUS9108 [Anthophora plagiata]